MLPQQTLPQHQKRKQQQDDIYQREDWAQQNKDNQRIIKTKLRKYKNEMETIKIHVLSATSM